MNNVLREIESEEVVVYRSHVYSPEVLAKCRVLHAGLVKEGKLSGAFESDRWVGYSGVKRFGVEFSVDRLLTGTMWAGNSGSAPAP